MKTRHEPLAGEVRLEPLLARHLRPVTAPPQLWARVVLPAEHRRRSQETGRRLAWCLTAALIVLMAIWGFSLRSEAVPVNEAIALQLGARKPENLTCRSGDVSRVRNWIVEKTGLDVFLPPVMPHPGTILGARVLDSGTPAVDVAYRVGQVNASLLISKSPLPIGARSRLIGTTSYERAGVIAWTAGPQLYTLAFAGEDSQACLRCHVAGVRTALN